MAIALETEVGRSQGDRGQFDRGASHRTDLDPVHGAAAIGPFGEESHDGLLRRLTPQVVDHDVDFGGCSAKRSCRCLGIVGEMDDLVGTDGHERIEAGEVAPGADDSSGKGVPEA